MTVEKNITFGLENLRWDKADTKHRVDELSELLKIEDMLNERRQGSTICGALGDL
jgi:ABC-type sugar transport system ATPase subunit